MEINLCKDYRMTTSTLNFVLEKRMAEYENKKGEKVAEKWVVSGYFSSIKSLLQAYKRKKTLNCNAVSIEELIKKIDEVGQVIENFKVV